MNEAWIENVLMNSLSWIKVKKKMYETYIEVLEPFLELYLLYKEDIIIWGLCVQLSLSDVSICILRRAGP